MVCVGAGLGVTSTPAAESLVVMVMVPATVPVISGTEGPVSWPAGIGTVAVWLPPAVVRNCTSLGLPPTADWKLKESVPITATGYALVRDNVTLGCVAGFGGIGAMLAGGGGGRLMVMLMVFVAVCFCASVTVKPRAVVPGAVGVPLRTPFTKLRPAGGVPLVSAKVYGVVPPVAAKVTEKAVPTVPEASPVVIDGGVPGGGDGDAELTLDGLCAGCPGAES